MRALLGLALLLCACGDDVFLPDGGVQDAKSKDAAIIQDAAPVPDASICPWTDPKEARMLWMQTAKILCIRVNMCEIQPYVDCYADFEADEPKINSVRCKEDLIDHCWPWLRTAPCDAFLFGHIDASCRGAFRGI